MNNIITKHCRKKENSMKMNFQQTAYIMKMLNKVRPKTAKRF